MTTATLDYRPFDAGTWRDPFTLYQRLRDEDPVHRSSLGVWVLTRFRHVVDAARDTDSLSSAQGLTFTNEREALGLAPTIVMMDPPDHTRYRRLVSRLFTPRQVGSLEPAVRHEIVERLERLKADGGGDLVEALARPVPAFVVGHFLGVPPEDRGRFERWTASLVSAQAGQSYTEAADALGELYGYFTDLVADRRHDRGDDMISALLAADDDVRGIGIEGILGYAFVMIAGGNDTTTGLLAGAAAALHERPDQRRLLADDPGLAGNAVEELLRLISPVQGLCRVAARDLDIDGTTIPAGDRILLCYAAANRDPREFGPDAEVLDVTRPIERHLAFSSGSHHCLGAAAARLQGRAFVEELVARCPDFTVDVEAGRYAGGAFTRRHEFLPFRPI